MRARLFALAFVLVASSAFAQPAYVDHRTYPADFNTTRPGDAVADRPGYVWRHDGKGWYFELATAPTPLDIPRATPPIENLPAECDPWPNPYAEQERAVRCLLAANDKTAPSIPTYRVMGHYATPYRDQRMVVLAVTRGVDESIVVTAQWLTTAIHPDARTHEVGDVFAFKASSADPWRVVVP